MMPGAHVTHVDVFVDLFLCDTGYRFVTLWACLVFLLRVESLGTWTCCLAVTFVRFRVGGVRVLVVSQTDLVLERSGTTR
jgi:hypothetical protein